MNCGSGLRRGLCRRIECRHRRRIEKVRRGAQHLGYRDFHKTDTGLIHRRLLDFHQNCSDLSGYDKAQGRVATGYNAISISIDVRLHTNHNTHVFPIWIMRIQMNMKSRAFSIWLWLTPVPRKLRLSNGNSHERFDSLQRCRGNRCP